MEQAQLGTGIYTFNRFSPRVVAAFNARHISAEQMVDAVRVHTAPNLNLVRVHQVHGAEVLCADSDKDLAGADADGLMTSRKQRVLSIRTADCLPVFFEDPAAPAIALVHAGWRGLKAGILEEAVCRMGRVYRSSPEKMRVGIGPAIRGCCYEVGPEFAGGFPAAYRSGRISGSPEPGGMFDPVCEAVDRLTKAGITPGHIEDSGFCTACRTDLFFSFRREKTAARILSLMFLL